MERVLNVGQKSQENGATQLEKNEMNFFHPLFLGLHSTDKNRSEVYSKTFGVPSYQ
jgi:hypothetical protein